MLITEFYESNTFFLILLLRFVDPIMIVLRQYNVFHNNVIRIISDPSMLFEIIKVDFNLGLGYLNADFEKYEVIDGVRVRCGNETKNWCGPINAGVTLVWKLF